MLEHFHDFFAKVPVSGSCTVRLHSTLPVLSNHMASEVEELTEFEKARREALIAEEQHIMKQQKREELRKMVQQMKFLIAVEETADKFMESALMIDSAKDYPEGWRFISTLTPLPVRTNAPFSAHNR